jgi:hypothetical protein
MKKLALILALLMIPSFAMALDTISDSDLNAVTGQAGVSILINSVTIVKSSQVSGYGDPDATGTHWVNIVQVSDATTKIGFHGTEPLMIDIIDCDTINSTLAMASAETIMNLGPVGVQIKLPDMIEIQATPQLDGIYMNNVAGSTTNLMLYRYNGGGTTKIIGDLDGDNHQLNSLYPTNFADVLGWHPTLAGGNNQTTIVITTH